MANSASHMFGTPVLDLNAFNMDHAPKDLVSAKVIAEARALPLYKRGNRLFVAIADPD